RWYPAGSSAASARRRALASGRRARTGLDGRATVQVANVAALRLRVRLGGLCQSEGAIGVPWIAPRSAARRRARAGHMRAGARRHSPAAVAPRRGGRCAPGRSPAVPSQPYGKSDRNRRAVAALRLTRPVRQTPGRTRGAARSGRVRPEAAQPTTPRPWWRTQIAGELRSDPALPGVRIHGSGSHCWNDALAAAARTATRSVSDASRGRGNRSCIAARGYTVTLQSTADCAKDGAFDDVDGHVAEQQGAAVRLRDDRCGAGRCRHARGGAAGPGGGLRWKLD